MVMLDSVQGKKLVRLAHRSIAAQLHVEPEEIVETDQFDTPAFQEKRGVFVTLKMGGKLRGCIGSLTAHESIKTGIERNACNAAFNDPRFSPLTANEFAETEIEISILTEPQPLAFKDGADLLAKLRPNTDGVIIKSGSASATFLPQVWEQLPRADDFLTHLCLKAGLPAAAWKTGRIEVSIYQVQHFND